ncbi:hypothetical protein [Ferruginibacter sp. HRS2-29]|uniref:hypothetical protein n=1 Tax=Ferruginibacter sp. HRS2-29 TaxID=2487334 RepID=UPI0020CC1117|nr:hypothetical protein [Ferruginibacter sp. HRS2-29]MCP9752413.1 hypothetical protein [Ferruginibacter sp. HRS2-29]
MSFLLTIESLLQRIGDNIQPQLTGSVCFWGQWFGKPNGHLCTIISAAYDEASGELRLSFSGNQLLSVFEPENISIEDDLLTIGDARKVRMEWPDAGKDGRLKNRLYYEFNRLGKKVTGISNIHWSSIDQTSLSVNRPAVLMTHSLS